MQKACFKCKVDKPLSEFYKHFRMADGHLNKCKKCAKDDVKEHRLKNIEKVREYDRLRGKLPERIKAGAAITKIWRAEDKRRGKAHKAVYRAVKNGKLVREPCCRCGNEKTLAHHEDYDKPLDVMWLCQPCHKQRHKEINAS
jgi:ribosomal protein S27AE